MDFIARPRNNVELSKELHREMKNKLNGKNVQNMDGRMDFITLQNEAQKYRECVHAQDVFENAVNDEVAQRNAILEKMRDHAQLLQLKVERRQKLQKNAQRDLDKMNITEIGEELEHLRTRFIIICYLG